VSTNNIKIAESPNHFMVLDAISRGIEDIDKISKVTKLSKADAELIVNDLSAQRLVSISEKKRLFGKKTQSKITNVGSRLLHTKKHELEMKAGELQRWYNSGDRKTMQSFMDDNRAWMPMMIFSGIMSAVFFASMMSFMGMAMNPAEAATAGDGGDAGTGGAESQAASDGGSGVADAGEANMSDGGSGFDAGNFGEF
jgi:hypothetical protein